MASLRWWRPYLVHVEHARRDPREREALRGCAVAKGLPDLWLFLPRGGNPFAVVELKAPGGAPDPEQEAWLLFLQALGAGCGCVCEGWESAYETLNLYAGARLPSDPPPPTVDALPALARAVTGARA